MAMGNQLILSIFPGADLLGRGFEAEGYCVVRGPDKIWGGDVRDFHPPSGHFAGLIGGSPCQDFSSLRRPAPTGEGLELLGEFIRVVSEAAPEWFLLENVPRVPDVTGPTFSLPSSYHVTRADVNLSWYCDSTRLRHVQFGSLSGRTLQIERVKRRDGPLPGAALASDDRTFDELCELQGLPPDFDLPGLTVEAKKRAVGNGVPIPMAKALARAVRDAYTCDGPDGHTLQLRLDGPPEPAWRCACGCGRRLSHGHRYYDDSCRKRAQRLRDRAIGRQRVWP